ncbi:uncharacterized protein A1O5_07357 [Cladophialophora psammophila CBS 110553]|uniref:GST N-terminal domain-containing protein n=1 Tax=Cladophialophora psammophila CBS 110553 TaxID=1182543 RepID=W9WXD3_9EURO|nr:uncharacterized protein A1O5_07357 [Cladophialophora psammophila CBS 110553]EXJ69321.1 hypothetical protein A1O5_07357 [Cladophialophora psammophila CBS 110553]
MEQDGTASAQYKLYYNSFSICSLMVLLTLRWKGQPKSPALAVDPVETEIDIYAGHQNDEEYLEKNWKGQVPLLLGPQSVEITDSLDITRFLGERYSQLLPGPHCETINALLDELHEIWFVSLSFTADDGRSQGIVNMIQERIAHRTSSEKYKAALQRKLQFLMDSYPFDPHNPEIVAREEIKARTYLERIAHNIVTNNPGGKATWIFGDGVGPTALDAHTVVFVARLVDASRPYLIPDGVLAYGRQHLEKGDWAEITQGNSTLHTLWEKQEERRALEPSGRN